MKADASIRVIRFARSSRSTRRIRLRSHFRATLTVRSRRTSSMSRSTAGTALGGGSSSTSSDRHGVGEVADVVGQTDQLAPEPER